MRVLAITMTAASLVSCGNDNDVDVATTLIDGRPSAVTVAGDRVWVTEDANNSVHTFDTESGEEIGRPVRVARNPIAVAASSDAVWVAHASGSVIRIDAGTRKAGRKINVGGSLTGITVFRSRPWVTDNEHGELIEIDPERSTVAKRRRLADGAVRVVGGDEALWASGQENTVTRIDPLTDRRSRHKVGLGPIGLAYDGDKVWVANSDDGTVQPINGDPVPVGGGPVGVAIAGGRAWSIDQDDKTTTPVDIESLEPGPPVPIAPLPRGIAADGDVLWIVGTNPGALVRVEL